MSIKSTEIDVYVGQRIRQRREELGISQGQLGRCLGVTFSQIQKYEKGSNRVGAGRLYIIARELGVPVEFFFDRFERNIPSDVQIDDLYMRDVQDAFRSIRDADTRSSVLALVKSLANTGVSLTMPSGGVDTTPKVRLHGH